MKKKYGIPLRNNEPQLEGAREFDADHWERMQKNGAKGWIKYPELELFISFAEPDRQLMLNLKGALKKSELLRPIVVEDTREGAKDLSDLIISGIKDSKYFVPILTRNSYHTQWINQEIGFARSLTDQLEIIPLIDKEIISTLKGFVHNQKQLAYTFSMSGSEKQTKLEFRKAYKGLLGYVEGKILKGIERAK